MSTFRKAASILALIAVASTATAQSLDAHVVRNQDDTVTYTIDVDGPPRGNFMLFVSPLALVNPIQLPGIGNLHLNPKAIFPVAPALPLNATGRGTLSLRVPIGPIHDRPLHFQALVFAPFGPMRTTDFLSTWYKESGSNFSGGGQRYNLKSQPGKQMVSGTVRGEAGKVFEIRIENRNRVVKKFTARIGRNGELTFGWGYQGYRIQHGDRVISYYDGKPVGLIQY